MVIYVNKACLILFGRPRTREEVEQWWNQAPEHIIGPCRAILRVVHEALQVCLACKSRAGVLAFSG